MRSRRASFDAGFVQDATRSRIAAATWGCVVEARAASAEAWLGRFQGEIATAFGEIPRLLGEIDQRLDGGPEPQARVAAGR